MNLATTPWPIRKKFEALSQKTIDNCFGNDVILYETIVNWAVNYVWQRFYWFVSYLSLHVPEYCFFPPARAEANLVFETHSYLQNVDEVFPRVTRALIGMRRNEVFLNNQIERGEKM